LTSQSLMASARVQNSLQCTDIMMTVTLSSFSLQCTRLFDALSRFNTNLFEGRVISYTLTIVIPWNDP
jgi:hypothetical protein